MSMLAVVGTRAPSLEGLALVKALAMPYIEDGWHVITGGADGVDGFIMEVMNKELKFPDRLHVSLPWIGYGAKYMHDKNLVTVFDKNKHTIWLEYVDKFHPNPNALTQGARALLARDYDVANRCDEMIALPNTKPGGGGTGHTMRIAASLGKKIINVTEMLAI